MFAMVKVAEKKITPRFYWAGVWLIVNHDMIGIRIKFDFHVSSVISQFA